MPYDIMANRPSYHDDDVVGSSQAPSCALWGAVDDLHLGERTWPEHARTRLQQGSRRPAREEGFGAAPREMRDGRRCTVSQGSFGRGVTANKIGHLAKLSYDPKVRQLAGCNRSSPYRTTPSRSGKRRHRHVEGIEDRGFQNHRFSSHASTAPEMAGLPGGDRCWASQSIRPQAAQHAPRLPQWWRGARSIYRPE